MEHIRDDLLGWHSFRNLLARFAATPSGQDCARALTPHHELTPVRQALEATTEARRALTAEGPPPWDGTGDARPILAEATPAAAVLDGPALVVLGHALTAAARLATYGQRIAAIAPTLAATWAALPTCPDLARLLHDALEPDGRVTDRASPRLRALRRQITALRADLQARVERLLDHPGVAPALQERYVTVRNGRYVIPVRDDARRAVRGIIHDRSQSGATVFVEPEETIPLNNELTRLCLAERDEEQRVLAELTDAVRTVLPRLGTSSRASGRSTSSSLAPPSPSASAPARPRSRWTGISTSARLAIPCWWPSGGHQRPEWATSSPWTSGCPATGQDWS